MHFALNKEGECFMDMLFESENQKEATERLLASVMVRTINSEIDAYLNEMRF